MSELPLSPAAMDNITTMSKSKKKRLKKKNKKVAQEGHGSPIIPEEDAGMFDNEETQSETVLSPEGSSTFEPGLTEGDVNATRSLDQLAPAMSSTGQDQGEVLAAVPPLDKEAGSSDMIFQSDQVHDEPVNVPLSSGENNEVLPTYEETDQGAKSAPIDTQQEQNIARETVAVPPSSGNVQDSQSDTIVEPIKEQSESIPVLAAKAPISASSAPPQSKSVDQSSVKASSFLTSTLPATSGQHSSVDNTLNRIEKKDDSIMKGLSGSQDDFMQSVIDSKFIDVDSVIQQVKEDVEKGMYNQSQEDTLGESKELAANKDVSGSMTAQSGDLLSDSVKHGIQSVVRSSVIDTSSIIGGLPSQNFEPEDKTSGIDNPKQQADKSQPPQDKLDDSKQSFLNKSPSLPPKDSPQPASSNVSKPLPATERKSKLMYTPDSVAVDHPYTLEENSRQRPSSTNLSKASKTSNRKSALSSAKKRFCIIL